MGGRVRKTERALYEMPTYLGVLLKLEGQTQGRFHVSSAAQHTHNTTRPTDFLKYYGGAAVESLVHGRAGVLLAAFAGRSADLLFCRRLRFLGPAARHIAWREAAGRNH